MKDSIYLSKTLFFGTSTVFRKASIVIREKRFFQKNGFGIWWKLETGIGIHGKSGRILRHFTFGANIFNKICWTELSYLGYTKEDSRIAMYDQGEAVKIPKGIMDRWNTTNDCNSIDCGGDQSYHSNDCTYMLKEFGNE